MFTPDGQFSVTGSDDNTARLWNAVTGQRRGEPLRHAAAFVSVSFSPDGHTVITASRDTTARFWNAPPQAEDDPQRLKPSIEVRSGYYSDSRGVQRMLNQKQWFERKQRLESLGGPYCICRWEDRTGPNESEAK